MKYTDLEKIQTSTFVVHYSKSIVFISIAVEPQPMIICNKMDKSSLNRNMHTKNDKKIYNI